MNENDMLKAVLGNLSDIIVVEDENGKVCYQNHPQVKHLNFISPSQEADEFCDKKRKRWYKLATTTFELNNEKFLLKKYGHVTKLKKQQILLETDGKTGLLRYDTFREELKYLDSLKKGMIIVLIDIDHFKSINDCFGHEVGDDVLTKIGKLIKTVFRSNDLLGRFGGDELILSLINIDINIALKKLDVLKEAVSNIKLVNEENSHNVTISIGVSKYDSNLPYEENFRMADEALYESKHNGRNQISLYEECKKKILK